MKASEKALMWKIWGQPPSAINRENRSKLKELARSLVAAAKNEDAVAMTCLAYLIKTGLAKPGRPFDAERLVEQAARLGEPAAQLEFAVQLMKQRKMKEAKNWVRRSALGGLTEGMFRYALDLLETGRAKDARKAVTLLRKVHRRGHPSASSWLAYYYDQIAVDERRLAVRWSKKAAELGDERAMHNLGVIFEYGQGVRRSLATARYWYSRAADHGVKESRRALKRVAVRG